MEGALLPIKLLPLQTHYPGGHMGQTHDNCTGVYHIPWVWNIFQECVKNNVEYAGFLLGLISIFCWIVVFMPQFYENFKRGKMDEAIHPAFLILWMLGDMSNLVGCLLTGQLATQLITAMYYLLMDALIISQFIYYYCKNKRKRVQIRDPLQASSSQNGTGIQSPDSTHVIYCCTFLIWSGSLMSLSWQQNQPSSGYMRSQVNGRSLLSLDNSECVQYYKKTGECIFYNAEDIFGYVCGCFSGMFYVVSRLPQLIQNHRRGSVEGVSILMFVLTVLGNVFYGASVLMEDTSTVFLIRHFPWLVGSLGTLFFDCVMLAQFAFFGYCRPHTAKVEEGSEEERKSLLNGAAF